MVQQQQMWPRIGMHGLQLNCRWICGSIMLRSLCLKQLCKWHDTSSCPSITLKTATEHRIIVLTFFWTTNSVWLSTC
jgi:hypothetical protein